MIYELTRTCKEMVRGKFEGTTQALSVGWSKNMKNLSQNRLHWSLNSDLSHKCTEHVSGLVRTWPECSVPNSIKIKVDKDRHCTCTYEHFVSKWKDWPGFSEHPLKKDVCDSILNLRSQTSLIFIQLAAFVVDQISWQDSSTPISREWT
jgi:hypothetical protein